MVSPKNEILSVDANDLTWKTTWNTVSSCTVSPQNEFLNVLAIQMTGQKTLNTGSSCKVSH
jgi:hypothetical protein